ncbi:MAG: GntR family transcriptional regulator [Rhizobiaceae bacterium]
MSQAKQLSSNIGPVAITKREVAEVSIRNAIETGLYRPGQLISQRQIEEDLGLSVTPMREAIIVLTSNGIVERHSHQSIKVAEMTPERLRDIFRVREMLEVEAVKLTAANCDADLTSSLRRTNAQLETHIGNPELSEVNALDRSFHNQIFGACGNEALSWTIHRLKSSFPMYALWNEPGRLETSTSEHRRLIEALSAGDSQAAAEAQALHLSNGLAATISYLDHLLAERSSEE